MAVNRRTFLSQSALLSAGMMLSKNTYSKDINKAPFTVPEDFSILFIASKWGIKGSWDEFCSKAKEAGYHGVEAGLPSQEKERDAFFAALEKYKLRIALMASGRDADFEKHFAQFHETVETAASFKPLYVNCHSGRDYFTFEQNKQIIDFTIKHSRSSGVPIYHETHRSRMLFAAHIAENFIKQVPGLRLTLDISHWCNVHGTLLEDQQEAVSLALSRTDNIHARVGHAHSPQVSDPRAPEWKKEVDAHFQWWDRVVQHKIKAGQVLTVKPEFGPPNYMPVLPYTQQPVSDLWDINTYIMKIWKERYL